MTITDTIAGVLREHPLKDLPPAFPGPSNFCGCGEWEVFAESLTTAREHHADHVAEVITAAIEPEIREREWATASAARSGAFRQVALIEEPRIRADECRKAAEFIEGHEYDEYDEYVIWNDDAGDMRMELAPAYLRHRADQHEKEQA